jgi:hypothetical protein
VISVVDQDCYIFAIVVEAFATGGMTYHVSVSLSTKDQIWPSNWKYLT